MTDRVPIVRHGAATLYLPLAQRIRYFWRQQYTLDRLRNRTSPYCSSYDKKGKPALDVSPVKRVAMYALSLSRGSFPLLSMVPRTTTNTPLPNVTALDVE